MRFRRVTENSDGAKAIMRSLARHSTIAPIEAQIIGLMLENQCVGEITQEVFEQELGGREGLLVAYCRKCIDSSPRPDVSKKMLFALSVRTELRRPMSIEGIADIVHEKGHVIRTCIDFYQKQGLVIRRRAGHYELAHDYLAEIFHEYAGSELDATQRDNIVFFSEELRIIAPMSLDVTRPREQSIVFSDVVLGLLATLLIARLLGPAYGVHWDWLNRMHQTDGAAVGIDLYYIPVFLSHMAWFIYICMMYKWLLSNISESRIARVFSQFVVLNCAAVIILAVFVPYVWLLSIGIGGLPVGIKLFLLSRVPKSSASPPIAFLRRTGRNTIINVSIVILLGIWMIYAVETSDFSVRFIERMNLVSLATALVMTYYMLVVTPLHATQVAASRIMGLIDRPRVLSRRFEREKSNWDTGNVR